MEIVKLLVKRGANVHTINDAGYTALQLAMEMGHEEMFIFLLSNGATFASGRSGNTVRSDNCFIPKNA